jgi:hypothetical protein
MKSEKWQGELGQHEIFVAGRTTVYWVKWWKEPETDSCVDVVAVTLDECIAPNTFYGFEQCSYLNLYIVILRYTFYIFSFFLTLLVLLYMYRPTVYDENIYSVFYLSLVLEVVSQSN